MNFDDLRNVLRSVPARIFYVLALIGTASALIGPVLAAGLGVPVLRLAMGQPLSPFAGALEAGALASAVWWAFEA